MKNRKPREKRASFYDAHFYNILDYFILAVMVAGVLIFILYPLLCMIRQSFVGEEGVSTEVYKSIFKDCEVIYYGAHADDSAGFAYPDCSPVFNRAMNEAIWEGSGHQLKIEAPFVNVSKAEVVRIGLELNVPYELTWSCYEGGEKPCGKCGTCIDRAAAFQANHVEDPALQ